MTEQDLVVEVHPSTRLMRLVDEAIKKGFSDPTIGPGLLELSAQETVWLYKDFEDLYRMRRARAAAARPGFRPF